MRVTSYAVTCGVDARHGVMLEGIELPQTPRKERVKRENALLRSILLRVSPLITGEDVQTNQVRDEYVLFVTETLRVSVYTSVLASVASRFNPKTAMLPVRAVHRRTRRTVCRLTGGSGVDMKNERHTCCPLIKAFVPCPDASHLWLLRPHPPD